MQSDFLPTGMGYVYKLGDDNDPELVTIEVTNLRQRASSPYALLTASTHLPGARLIPGTDRVLNAEVWLLSERSRSDYAASLARLIPTPPGAQRIDWSAVLEEMAQRVIENENAPVPVQSLQQPTTKTSTTWLVENLIPASKPTILYGAGGTGKSIFAVALSVAVQMGITFLDRPTRRTEVLYLDWETDEDDIAHRVAAVSAGFNLPSMPNLRYASMVRPIEERVSALARYVAEENIGLVVIDSVGMALSSARDGGDASDTAIRFFRALRALDAASLAIDHVSGADMSRGRAGAGKPYGSVYKWNSARNAYELRERKDPDNHGVHLLLKHRKSNLGKRQYDLPVRMVWNEQANTTTFNVEQWAPPTVQPLPEQIMDVLAVAPATPRQIAEFLTDEEATVNEIDVRREVKSLIGVGMLTAGGDGQIRVVRDKPPVAESDTLLQD